MEKGSQRNLHLCLSLAELVGFLIFDAILIKFKTIQKFCLRVIQNTTFLRVYNEEYKNYVISEGREGLELRREDVEVVMKRIGMSFDQEGDNANKVLSSSEFSAMFDENEPSSEERKEVFSVFDENRDGFIDATELQRVLHKLGFGEGIDLNACHRMIAVHDQNQDGQIDFHEFVKFMENSFC